MGKFPIGGSHRNINNDHCLCLRSTRTWVYGLTAKASIESLTPKPSLKGEVPQAEGSIMLLALPHSYDPEPCDPCWPCWK